MLSEEQANKPNLSDKNQDESINNGKEEPSTHKADKTIGESLRQTSQTGNLAELKHVAPSLINALKAVEHSSHGVGNAKKSAAKETSTTSNRQQQLW